MSGRVRTGRVRPIVHLVVSGALAAAVAGLTAPAAGAHTPARAEVSAPDCVGYSASWRYTLVTNGCGDAHEVTVRYRDGAEVPCRAVAPGQTVTFPGYGTQGDEVQGLRLCAATATVEPAARPAHPTAR
ncbi:alpha-amylase [Streptomyces sp. HMX112]|uniref:alpha-amylase n=1 Tax=Streptomyces sp. HMX112 TaxID=3390850 RepID=UPI003A810AAF